jgi:hypothetical protein
MPHRNIQCKQGNDGEAADDAHPDEHQQPSQSSMHWTNNLSEAHDEQHYSELASGANGAWRDEAPVSESNHGRQHYCFIKSSSNDAAPEAAQQEASRLGRLMTDGSSGAAPATGLPDSCQGTLAQLQQQQQQWVLRRAADLDDASSAALICDSDGVTEPYSLGSSCCNTLSSAQVMALQESVKLLHDYHHRWIHCVGRTTLKALPGSSNVAHQLLLGGLYRFLADNTRQVTGAWNIPTKHLIELGMDIEV